MKFGIDVSYANGKIDWAKTQRPDFMVIKASTGVNCPDNQLENNAYHAEFYGIPCTYYHWATLKTFDVVSDAKQEAADFLSRISRFVKPSYPLVLDFEEENLLKFPPELMQMWVLTFYSELKKAGHEMLLYSYKPHLNDNLPNNHILGHIPLWIAGYPWDKESNVGIGGRVLGYANIPLDIPNQFEIRQSSYTPRGWKRDDILMWQYTGQGQWSGINGHVDLNVMF